MRRPGYDTSSRVNPVGVASHREEEPREKSRAARNAPPTGRDAHHRGAPAARCACGRRGPCTARISARAARSPAAPRTPGWRRTQNRDPPASAPLVEVRARSGAGDVSTARTLKHRARHVCTVRMAIAPTAAGRPSRRLGARSSHPLDHDARPGGRSGATKRLERGAEGQRAAHAHPATAPPSLVARYIGVVEAEIARPKARRAHHHLPLARRRRPPRGWAIEAPRPRQCGERAARAARAPRPARRASVPPHAERRRIAKSDAAGTGRAAGRGTRSARRPQHRQHREHGSGQRDAGDTRGAVAWNARLDGLEGERRASRMSLPPGTRERMRIGSPAA
jgi:hypothetical protein